MTEHSRNHNTQHIGLRFTEKESDRKGILWIEKKYLVLYCDKCKKYIEKLLTTTHKHASSDEVVE